MQQHPDHEPFTPLNSFFSPPLPLTVVSKTCTCSKLHVNQIEYILVTVLHKSLFQCVTYICPPMFLNFTVRGIWDLFSRTQFKMNTQSVIVIVVQIHITYALTNLQQTYKHCPLEYTVINHIIACASLCLQHTHIHTHKHRKNMQFFGHHLSACVLCNRDQPDRAVNHCL